MDGFEVILQISQTNKEVINTVQSEFTNSGEREKAKEAGCNVYVTKPIDKLLYELIIKYYN